MVSCWSCLRSCCPCVAVNDSPLFTTHHSLQERRGRDPNSAADVRGPILSRVSKVRSAYICNPSAVISGYGEGGIRTLETRKSPPVFEFSRHFCVWLRLA